MAKKKKTKSFVPKRRRKPVKKRVPSAKELATAFGQFIRLSSKAINASEELRRLRKKVEEQERIIDEIQEREAIILERFERIITLDNLPPRMFNENHKQWANRIGFLIVKQGIWQVDEAYLALANHTGITAREAYSILMGSPDPLTGT